MSGPSMSGPSNIMPQGMPMYSGYQQGYQQGPRMQVMQVT